MFKFKLVKIFNLIHSSTYIWVFYTFLFTNLLVLTKIFGSNAKTTTIILFLLIIIINFKIRKLIVSTFLVAIYTLQFYVPNKYYIIEVLKSIQLSSGSGSYLLSYGLNLENIFIFTCLILIIRSITIDKSFKYVKLLKFTAPIFISAIFYFCISFYSSLFISPFSPLSIIWLLQFMQLFIVGFSFFYIYLVDKDSMKFIIPVISSSLLLQGIIGIFQFIKQSWMGLPVESFRIVSTYYGGVDAVDSIFRIAGTFGHPNQLGILVLLMTIILIPTALKKRGILLIFSVSLGTLIILLTQSRSSWLSLLITYILALTFYKNLFLNFIKSLGIKRFIVYTSLLFISTSFVIVPRILRSVNLLNQGGSVPLRVEMIKEARQGILLSMWAGYGIGTNEITLFKLFPGGYNFSFPAPVHNAFFQIMLESGIIGLIAFIFPFLYIARIIANNSWSQNYKNKDFIFIFIASTISISIFYIFLPHEGIREFAYLGIVLGYGMIAVHQLKLLKR